ncbi:hypothetical protein HJG60_007842 [Phyllostomus discolor]|uniref:Potassium channel domain-containing protein n=1 Tax=Phyllostomus discolor TaxID=89673 RepID=A0A834BHK0_9CHIR|nr:hypothetical protein HJG60_007842 [Phyllostomus discolor]
MNHKDSKKFSFKASRFILLIGFMGYCLMGAKIFQALETDAQEKLKDTFVAAKQELMNDYASISPEKLEAFLQLLTFSVKNGIVPALNGTTYITWNLRNSFSFVASTLSTIGYGSIAPKTPMGQIFCVFYALLGIPLTIIFLKSVGNAILRPFSGLEKYLQNKGMQEVMFTE